MGRKIDKIYTLIDRYFPRFCEKLFNNRVDRYKNHLKTEIKVRGNEILLTIITDKYKKKLILVSILMPKNTLRSLMEWGNENIGGVNEI